MGNARWTGVRLRDVLERTGVTAGALAVRFNGFDERSYRLAFRVWLSSVKPS